MVNQWHRLFSRELTGNNGKTQEKNPKKKFKMKSCKKENVKKLWNVVDLSGVVGVGGSRKN